MKKYKLIKEYPGSPKLGTIALPYTNNRGKVVHYIVEHPEKYCDYLGIGKTVVEHFYEYWEEVNDNIFWCVWEKDFIQYDVVLFKAWTPNEIECIKEGADSNRHYFKTKEEAEQYIIKNKPCLSLNDVGLILGGLSKKRDIFLELKRIVKSKL